ncbi:hypothetical protein vseg_006130 [Gypsophila vaccaria]
MSVMVVTSLGELVIDLFTDRCPLTCKNFLKLCKIKYYNGCLFHTVQKDFTAQTGDPTGSGSSGDSIYKFIYGDQARFFKDEIHPDLKHLKMGTVAMASAGENLNASQFYITLRDDLDYLDEKHTVFGEVAEGHDTLLRINEAYVDDSGRPFKNIRIKHTYVLDDPFEDPPQLAGLIPDASPEGKPKEEVIDEVRLEDDWVPMDAILAPEELEEAIRAKEAHSRAVVLETIGDLPVADVKPPENVLFVCKLNPVTEDEDLHTIFSRFGTVTSAEVIRDYKTGDSLCYAFIEFEDKDACEQAYYKMGNALIDDRRIRVDFSQSVSKIWNEFRRKSIQGKGCYKCGSLDHIAKDCEDGSTIQHQKYVLKDNNQQHGGDRNADYDMVFDEDGSPQHDQRCQDFKGGSYNSEKIGTVGSKHRDYGSRDLSELRKNDKPAHDGMRGVRDHIDIRKGHGGDDKDERAYKRSHNRVDRVRDDKYGDRTNNDIRKGHGRDDKDDRAYKRSQNRGDRDRDDKYGDRTNSRDYREKRDEIDHRKRFSETDTQYKRGEPTTRRVETEVYRDRREDRKSSKGYGNVHDERDEPRGKRKGEEQDGKRFKDDTHRGTDKRRRDDRR